MHLSLTIITLLVYVTLWAGSAAAAKRHPAPVPPDLEIEVLDPGQDPMGFPAVNVEDKESTKDRTCDEDSIQDDGEQIIDIPPCVLVHRYYYTGDRSFQAQLLAGGPSIVVANHPRTGERVYIPVQMLPGAPRVTYTSHSIEYDYGQHAITVVFGTFGKPRVKYRSGIPWPRRVKNMVHAEELKEHTKEIASRSAEGLRHTGTVAVGATVVASDATKQVVITPVKQVLQLVPFGKVVFAGDLADKLEARAVEHKREAGIRKAEKAARRDEETFATIR